MKKKEERVLSVGMWVRGRCSVHGNHETDAERRARVPSSFKDILIQGWKDGSKVKSTSFMIMKAGFGFQHSCKAGVVKA